MKRILSIWCTEVFRRYYFRCHIFSRAVLRFFVPDNARCKAYGQKHKYEAREFGKFYEKKKKRKNFWNYFRLYFVIPLVCYQCFCEIILLAGSETLRGSADCLLFAPTSAQFLKVKVHAKIQTPKEITMRGFGDTM